jgi:hypothetical protein
LFFIVAAVGMRALAAIVAAPGAALQCGLQAPRGQGLDSGSMLSLPFSSPGRPAARLLTVLELQSS